MKKITSAIIGVVIFCMCFVTPVCAAENSETSTIDGNIQNVAIAEDEELYCTNCTLEALEHNHINSTSACDHNGTKVPKYVGKCYCGGMLYRIDCTNCGAFIRAVCANSCGYWDNL